MSGACLCRRGPARASQATKYLLRCGKILKAEQTIAIFTRHEGDPQHNLYEMQCRCGWYRTLVHVLCRTKANQLLYLSTSVAPFRPYGVAYS